MSGFDDYYNSLGTSQSDDSFDSYYKSIPTKVASAQPAPKQTSKNGWSLGASLRNIDAGLGQIITPQMRKATQQQQELESSPDSPIAPDPQGQRNFARRAAAVGAGLYGLGDAAFNLPRVAINKLGGNVPYTHFRDDFNSLPGIRELRQDAPEYFDTYADTAATVLPLPGRAGEALKDTAWINKTLGRRVADAAMTQGAFGAATSANAKVQEGQDPSLLDVGVGFAGGAVLGGAAHGLVEGIGSLANRRPRVVPSAQEPIGPAHLPAEDIAANLEGEDAQIFNQMRSAGTPQQPLQGRVQQVAQGPSQPEDVLSTIDALKNGSQAYRGVQGLIQQAADNVPGQGRIGRAPDRGRDYLDYNNAQPMPVQGLNYPDYLDFDQRPKPQFTRVDRGGGPQPLGFPDYVDFSREGPTWNMRDYLDVNKHPDDLKFPNYLDLGNDASPLPAKSLVETKASSVHKPIKYLDDNDLRDLEVSERQRFPNATRDIFAGGYIQGHDRIEKLNVKSLTDDEIEQSLESFNQINRRKFNKPAERASARQDMEALLEEKMRREQRRVLGVQQDWAGGVPDVRLLSEDQLVDVIGSGSEAAQEEAGRELLRRAGHVINEPVAQPEIVPPVEQPPQGEFRNTLPRSQYGHKEVFPGAGNTMLDPEGEMIMQQLAQTKAQLQIREQQIDELSKAFYERQTSRDLADKTRLSGRLEELSNIATRYRTAEEKAELAAIKKQLKQIDNRLSNADEGKSLSTDKLFISRGSQRKELNSKGVSLIDQLKSELQKPGDELVKIQSEHMQLSASAKALAQDPVDLSILDDEPALMDFVMQQAEDEKRLNGLKDLMYNKYKQQYGDNPKYWPSFDYTITVNDEPYTVLLKRHQESKTIKFADERADAVAAKTQELLQDPALTKTKVTPGKITIRKNILEGLTRSSLALSGLSLMGSDQKALAANQDKEKAVPGSATAIGALLLGAGFIKHPKLVGQILKTTAGKVAARAAFIYGDMLDHARSLDTKLGAVGNASLENQMLKHQALVLQSQFGVHFASQEQKAALYQMVREGAVTPAQALAGQDDFAQLNQRQREAIVNYYLYTKSMAKVVRDYRAKLEGAIATGLKVGSNEHASVVRLDEALTPRVTPVHDISSLWSMAQGNVMDGLFTLNPKHHLLNLTDSIIAGGSRTGPINMFKAWRDLSTDPELAAAFKNSGFFGNFRAERNEIAKRQVAGTLNVPSKEMDFGSDKFNADRVFLAGLYQRYQEKIVDMRKAGFASPQQFAKAVISGKADPAIAADAWAHAGEATMRTLGVDPLRMNRNNLQRSPVIQSVVSFVSQPIRMTRLIHEYIREGRTDRLAYLAGMTLLLGGQAAIPGTIKLLGNQFAPDYEQALEKAANDLSIPGAVGNTFPDAKPFIPNMSEKLNNDFLNPVSFAGVNVGLEMGTQALDGVVKTSQALNDGNYGAASSSAWKTAKNVSNLTGARVGPLPVSQVMKGAEALDQANTGQSPVSFYNNGKKIAEGVSVDLDNYPAGRLSPITQLVTPGQSQLSAELKANRREAAMRKKSKDKDGLYNTDPLAGLKTPKSKDVQKKKEKDLDEYINRILATKD